MATPPPRRKDGTARRPALAPAPESPESPDRTTVDRVGDATSIS